MVIDTYSIYASLNNAQTRWLYVYWHTGCCSVLCVYGKGWPGHEYPSIVCSYVYTCAQLRVNLGIYLALTFLSCIHACMHALSKCMHVLTIWFQMHFKTFSINSSFQLLMAWYLHQALVLRSQRKNCRMTLNSSFGIILCIPGDVGCLFPS